MHDEQLASSHDIDGQEHLLLCSINKQHFKGAFHTAGGSGSAYIYGLCDRHWKAGMSEEECKAFVQKAVSHAMARDGSSGGCIRTVSISKQGVKRDFVPGHSVPGHYGELPRPQPQRVAAS